MKVKTTLKIPHNPGLADGAPDSVLPVQLAHVVDHLVVEVGVMSFRRTTDYTPGVQNSIKR